MKGAVQLMTLDPCFLRSMRRVKPFGMLASHIVQADPIGCFLDPDDPYFIMSEGVVRWKQQKDSLVLVGSVRTRTFGVVLLYFCTVTYPNFIQYYCTYVVLRSTNYPYIHVCTVLLHYFLVFLYSYYLLGLQNNNNLIKK